MFRRNVLSPTSGEKCKNYVAPNRQYPSTRLHDIVTQKITIWLFASMKTSDHVKRNQRNLCDACSFISVDEMERQVIFQTTWRLSNTAERPSNDPHWQSFNLITGLKFHKVNVCSTQQIGREREYRAIQKQRKPVWLLHGSKYGANGHSFVTDVYKMKRVCFFNLIK
jgi:hypothetical protein